MKYTTTVRGLALSLCLLWSGCSVTNLQKTGTVEPGNFYAKLDFTTKKSVIVLEATVDGDVKNFLFDTGADLTIVQRGNTQGKTARYSGASKRKMSLGKEVLYSFELGGVTFKNTNALNGDLAGLKEQIPGFGGIIGQPIISKANWLIDYPNKSLEVSNADLADDSFEEIELLRSEGAPYTYISVNGNRHKVIIDFGSSSVINLPEGSKLAKELADQIPLADNQRERYTLGGLQRITEKVGVIPQVRLGSFSFEDVAVNINTSSQPRIGISFFRDYLIYIDNINGAYKLKKAE